MNQRDETPQKVHSLHSCFYVVASCQLTVPPILLFSLGASTSPISVGVADLDNNGRLDLVILSFAVVKLGTSNVAILLSNGDGTFVEQASFSIGSGCTTSSIAVGDFNRDDQVDLAEACYAADTVGVFFGDRNAAFGTKTVLPSAWRS